MDEACAWAAGDLTLRGRPLLCYSGAANLRTIRISQKIPASLDALWVACATPSGIAGWQADQVTGSVEAGETLGLGWRPGRSIHLDLLELLEHAVASAMETRGAFEVARAGERYHSAPVEARELVRSLLLLAWDVAYLDRSARRTRDRVSGDPARTTPKRARLLHATARSRLARTGSAQLAPSARAIASRSAVAAP